MGNSTKTQLESKKNTYEQLLVRVFLDKQKEHSTSIEFTRKDIIETASQLGVKLPKNIGDVVYAYRYRQQMPPAIEETCPEGMHWIIVGTGKGRYAFQLTSSPFLIPDLSLPVISIPDHTPTMIRHHHIEDEQGMLSKVRYNRLLDIFLGMATYPLQNHVRTYVQEIGQIEIDEMYMGIDKNGTQYVIPVQAKHERDRIGVVQLAQDALYCQKKYPNLVCLPLAIQWFSDGRIVMIRSSLRGYEAQMEEERHYQLTELSCFP